MVKELYIGRFKDQTTNIQESIQELQQSNRCCGVDSYKDYLQTKPYQLVPSSCCSKFEKGSKVTVGQCSVDELKEVKGCGDLLIDWGLEKRRRLENEGYSKMNFVLKVQFLFEKAYNFIYYPLKILAIILSVILIKSIVQSRNVEKKFESKI